MTTLTAKEPHSGRTLRVALIASALMAYGCVSEYPLGEFGSGGQPEPSSYPAAGAGSGGRGAIAMAGTAGRAVGGEGGTSAPVGSHCGNGVCDAGEAIWQCSVDCWCGNATCDMGEDVSACPADCGSEPSCGNGTCDAREDATSCPADCGPCSNGICEPSETAATCPFDCFCGNGTCDVGETPVNCVTDCPITGSSGGASGQGGAGGAGGTSGGQGGAGGEPPACPTVKIAFTQATGCLNDGSVEFCLPAADQVALARVRSISAGVSCRQGSSGRASCDVQTEELCQLPIASTQCPSSGPMPDELWLTVCRIALLDEVARIVPTWYE